MKKKDPDSPTGHKLRMVIDYRELNKITVKHRYPLPNIQDIFDKLAGSAVYSTLDMKACYHQFRIDPKEIPPTAFITPFGQYAWRVCPMGLCNSPSHVMAAVNTILSKAGLGEYTMAYLDDVIIYSKSAEDHAKHLDAVLTALGQAHLRVKLSKCVFNRPELPFLGHIVGRSGLRMDPKKVQVVQDWIAPTDLKQLRRFLGLANYFRRFIQGYASLVAPLTALTGSKTPWQWCDACQDAFEAVKKALISAPVLALPDLNKPYEVISDASLYGTGAVLMQEGRPLAYLSHRFTPAERNYTTTDQEALGVINALREWRCYLEGAPNVTVVTDHQPLTHLATLRADGLLSRRQARWIEFLQSQMVTWQYRPGRINVADPLSRVYEGAPDMREGPPPNQPQVAAMTRSSAHTDVHKRISSSYQRDAWFRKPSNTAELRKVNGLYYRGDQVVVPNDDELRTMLIAAHHDDECSGHAGPERTAEALKRVYSWRGLDADVARYVAQCSHCQRNKASTAKPRGLLQPLPIAKRVWGSVTMDLITHLPTTPAGYDSTAVFVDRLSKMTHFAPTHATVDAEGMAHLYVQNVFRHHGLPDEVISDRGPQFAGKFWAELQRLLKTSVKLSTAYHPQTDGQTERMNRLLEETLRHYINPAQDDWDDHLALVEFAINNAMNKSTRASPFSLNSPYAPRTPGTIGVAQSKVPLAASFAAEMQARLQRATMCLERARTRQKQAYDSHRQDASFAVGQSVLLSTKNIALKTPGVKKLLPKFIGPFPIEAKIGELAYKLTLPPGYRIHPVFHVSLLKPYHCKGNYQPPPPAFLDDDGNAYWTVHDVIEHRDRRVGRKPVRDFLVKWEGFGPEHNSWEPEANLREDELVADIVDKYLVRVSLRPPPRAAKKPRLT